MDYRIKMGDWSFPGGTKHDVGKRVYVNVIDNKMVPSFVPLIGYEYWGRVKEVDARGMMLVPIDNTEEGRKKRLEIAADCGE